MATPLPLPALPRRLSAYRRELATLALLGLAAAAAIAGIGDARIRSAQRPATLAAAPIAAPLPVAEPLVLRPVAARTALELNAAVPVSAAPNPAARPFSFARLPAESRARALECLTSTVYYEAAGEAPDGQRAVAQVVLNRVRHPAYPASVCGAVYQGAERSTGCQFTFTCDGSLLRRPSVGGWDRARRLAAAALDGAIYAPVGNSTHYHSQWVLPYWSASLVKSAVVGSHIFYRWSGGWGRPPAFAQAYALAEPDPQLLRGRAIAALAAGGQDSATVVANEPDPLLRLIQRQADDGGGERILLRVASPGIRAVAIDARPAYVERMDASPNLRWTLGQEERAAAEPALGRQPVAVPDQEPTAAAEAAAGSATPR